MVPSNEITEDFAEFLREHADEPGLGIYLSDLLIEAGIEKEVLADRAQLSMSFVYQLLRGEQPLSRDPQKGVPSAVDRVVKALAPEIAQRFGERIEHSRLRKELTDRVQQYRYVEYLQKQGYPTDYIKSLASEHWLKRNQIPALVSFGVLTEWLQKSRRLGQPSNDGERAERVLIEEHFLDNTGDWNYFCHGQLRIPGFIAEADFPDLDGSQKKFRGVVPRFMLLRPGRPQYRRLVNPDHHYDSLGTPVFGDDFDLSAEILTIEDTYDLTEERPKLPVRPSAFPLINYQYYDIVERPEVPILRLMGMVLIQGEMVAKYGRPEPLFDPRSSYLLTIHLPSRTIGIWRISLPDLVRKVWGPGAQIWADREVVSEPLLVGEQPRDRLLPGGNQLRIHREGSQIKFLINETAVGKFYLDFDYCSFGVYTTDLGCRWNQYFNITSLVDERMMPTILANLRTKFHSLFITQSRA